MSTPAASDPPADEKATVPEETQTQKATSLVETATRVRHGVSLVTTLPAIRRIRNFLNPGSRLPVSRETMYLLGERYERSLFGDSRTGDVANDAAEATPEKDETSPSSWGDPGLNAFLDDFHSLIWITYRRGFPGIEPGASCTTTGVTNSTSTTSTPYGQRVGYKYTSDAGWGCTLRVGQMVLAQALRVHFFGRGWRRPRVTNSLSNDSSIRTGSDASHDTLKDWFADHPSETVSPFGIHQVFRWARGELGGSSGGEERKEKIDPKPKALNLNPKPQPVPTGPVPGKWLGPVVMAQAIAGMVNHSKPGGLCAYILANQDGSFGGGAPALVKEKVAQFACGGASTGDDASVDNNKTAPRGESPPVAVDLPDAPFSISRRRVRTSKQSEEVGKQSEALGNSSEALGNESEELGNESEAALGNSSDAPRSSPDSTSWRPCLLLVPLKLGVERTVNPAYVPSLIAVLQIKQSVGILGGTPGASLFLAGAQGDRIFYLDPHTVFPYEAPGAAGGGVVRGEVMVDQAVGSNPGGNVGSSGDTTGTGQLPSATQATGQLPSATKNANGQTPGPGSTRVCEQVLHLEGKTLDPCMVLGFYLRAKVDLDELCVELALLEGKAGATPLVTVVSGTVSVARDTHEATDAEIAVGKQKTAASDKSDEVVPSPVKVKEETETETEEEAAERGAATGETKNQATSEDDDWESDDDEYDDARGAA